jgi:AcrR family transcriptional regulator
MARIAGSDSVKTRALICEKALALSAQAGFEALTMRVLAAAAGIQVAAIYHYFPDKQSLLASLLIVHFDRLLEGVRALPQGTPASVRLLSFAQFHIAFHAAQRLQCLFAAQELRSLNRTNARIILPKRQAYERVLQHILRDGVADKSLAVLDPGLSAAAVLAMLTEIAIWFRPDGKATLDETALTYAHVALKMVAA